MGNPDILKNSPPFQLFSHILMTKHLQISWQDSPQGYICRNTEQNLKTISILPLQLSAATICLDISGDSCVVALLCGGLGRCDGATACEASGRWCVLHVNHQMFLKWATGGGGGRREATAGRVGWLPRGLGCHQEPWAQTADLAHTWTPRLSLGKK